MRDKFTVLLIVSTLFIKELWTLFPDSSDPMKMFPYSETLISKQTYIWFMCYYSIQLIIVHVWYLKFPDFRLIFKVWFIFQALEFIEFCLTYNEAKFWFYIGQLRMDLNIINFKYISIFSLFIHKLWKT